MKKLSELNCESCKAVQPLQESEIENLLEGVKGWSLEGRKIRKSFRFENFRDSVRFVNKIADIAEGQQHHPDIDVCGNSVDLVFWTHSVKGLSKNDFIVAAKVDEVDQPG